MRQEFQQMISHTNPVKRNTAGLRDALFDELDALRQGSSDSSKANATAKLCGVIIESVRMELEVRKYLQMSPTFETDSKQALGLPIALSE